MESEVISLQTTQLKPIESYYKGYRFRSRLEARWAVFFDACGVEWEYEPEGFELGNGMYYLPDFRLRNVRTHHLWKARLETLYVEVKGKMTEDDARKIQSFVHYGSKHESENDFSGEVTNPLIILGEIPKGDSIREIEDGIAGYSYTGAPFGDYYYNFLTVDNDYFGCMPAVSEEGNFTLYGLESSYTCYMSRKRTEQAYRAARQARFEHGEHP